MKMATSIAIAVAIVMHGVPVLFPLLGLDFLGLRFLFALPGFLFLRPVISITSISHTSDQKHPFTLSQSLAYTKANSSNAPKMNVIQVPVHTSIATNAKCPLSIQLYYNYFENVYSFFLLNLKFRTRATLQNLNESQIIQICFYFVAQ